MSWLRIDDNMPSHPKIRVLSHYHFRCWINLLCVCSQHDDSTVDKAVIRQVAGLGPAIVRRFVDVGLLDENPHGYAIHNWNLYRPKDPTAAERSQRHRDRKRDDDRDANRDATVAPRARAALPDPTRNVNQAAADTTPREPPDNRDEDRKPAAALAEKLDNLNITGALRLAAFADPERALACAVKAETSAKGNPAGYFRRLLESGDQPTTISPSGDTFRPYDPPKAPITIIRTMITNGAITNLIDLDAELAAHGINGDTATELRALIDPADDLDWSPT